MDWTLEALQVSFGLTIQQAPLFPEVSPIPMPMWLQETLDRGMPFALGSEKARSEFIVAPVLLALREINHNQIALYSGQRLEGDSQAGLVGECDFLITPTAPLPLVQAPVVSIVEAKKNDIESGLGQCAAQMLGAQRFNQRSQRAITTIHGCVTTGEVWQMLRVEENILTVDTARLYINELETILGTLHAMVQGYLDEPT